MSFVSIFTHHIPVLILRVSVGLKCRWSRTLARPVLQKQAAAFQLKHYCVPCIFRQTDTLDTRMFSIEVHMESYLVKHVTRVAVEAICVSIHMNILYRCYYVNLKVKTQPEGDLIGTFYIYKANTLTTRLGVFWVTALSLPLPKPSHYSARSIWVMGQDCVWK